MPQWPFYNRKPEPWLPARVQKASAARPVDLGVYRLRWMGRGSGRETLGMEWISDYGSYGADCDIKALIAFFMMRLEESGYALLVARLGEEKHTSPSHGTGWESEITRINWSSSPLLKQSRQLLMTLTCILRALSASDSQTRGWKQLISRGNLIPCSTSIVNATHAHSLHRPQFRPVYGPIADIVIFANSMVQLGLFSDRTSATPSRGCRAGTLDES